MLDFKPQHRHQAALLSMDRSNGKVLHREPFQSVRPRHSPFSFFFTLTLLALIITLTGGCSLPTIDNRTVSVALPTEETLDTPLGRAIAPLAAEHPGESGVFALGNPRESFAVRVLLARAAAKTLDVQYYIWQNDTTGTLLMAALQEAAERGVRVRLLLDDHGTGGIDAHLMALNSHPNIEVRLFNPFANRGFKLLGYTYDFFRLNRRMHNKSFSVDGQATVIGGRNVGNEYFGATSGILKVDLDALLVGPIAEEVTRDFDRYWASGSSYPIERIVTVLDSDEQASALHQIMNSDKSPEAKRYLDTIRESTFMTTLLEGDSGLLWSKVTMVTDDPVKGLNSIKGEGLLMRQIEAILAKPERSVILVTPYFVPTKIGTDFFVAIAKSGVEVRIITNALEATDVLPVHAGYSKRRKALLKAGVMLFEMKHIPGDVETKTLLGHFGSSASSLHAKTFVKDGERVFIGSFNFDPRSMNLNTELGFVIDNAALAGEMENTIINNILSRAYEVHLDENGTLYWLEQQGEEVVRLDKEPSSNWFKNALITFLGILPIEWLL